MKATISSLYVYLSGWIKLTPICQDKYGGMVSRSIHGSHPVLTAIIEGCVGVKIRVPSVLTLILLVGVSPVISVFCSGPLVSTTW